MKEIKKKEIKKIKTFIVVLLVLLLSWMGMVATVAGTKQEDQSPVSTETPQEKKK